MFKHMKLLFIYFIVISIFYCDKNKSPLETQVDKVNQIIGTWIISSYRWTGSLRNFNEFSDVISRMTFKDKYSGQIWLMDYGVITTDSPMNFNYTYKEELDGSMVLRFTTSPEHRDWYTLCYITGNELTLMYEDGSNYYGIDVVCILKR
jgi:hypothetical protein